MKASKDAIRTARQLVQATLVDGTVDATRAKGFVAKIKEKKPRGYLGILNAYLNQIRIELAKRHAVVESAVALDSKTESKVTADLKAKYGDDLTFEFKTNPELLGGMRVKVGSDVWDGSVRSRLQRLQEVFS